MQKWNTHDISQVSILITSATWVIINLEISTKQGIGMINSKIMAQFMSIIPPITDCKNPWFWRIINYRSNPAGTIAAINK